MSNYMEYLEESTNTVKSQKKLSLTILLATYLGIWAFALIVFWFFISGSDAMGYSLVFLWIILPVATLVISLLIGKNNHLGKGKWLTPIAFSVRNMIAIEFTRINVPHFELILIGAFFSVIGLGIGCLTYHIKSNSKKK